MGGAGLPTATWPSVAAGLDADEDETAPVVTTATSRASRIGPSRHGRALPYWMVAVPVMVVGWTMHRNLYVPAGRAGTW